MERIYAKAQREHEIERLKKLLSSVEGLPVGSVERTERFTKALEDSISKMATDQLDQLVTERKMVTDLLNKAQEEAGHFKPGSPEREAAYKRSLDEIIRAMAEAEGKMTVWDFSREKAQPVFASEYDLVIRPINTNDVDLYTGIRMQYSAMYRGMISTERHRKESLFLIDLCHPESFYCVIMVEGASVGYLGIKDTRADLWEIAIELDGKHTRYGYGPRSVKLFLNEVCRITGKTEFRATVETDNIPSQRCFDRLGDLVGLYNGGLMRLPEDQARFEENNLNLIDDNMRALATRLGVEPRKLLSHVLEYRIACPL